MVIQSPAELIKTHEVTNRYELLIYLQKNNILNQLVVAAIVGLSITTWLDIYKHYLVECEKNDKQDAVQFTADYWKLSDRQLYRIIKFMENQFT